MEPSRFSSAELEYDLPAELIAQAPAAERDGSRLLVVERKTGRLTDAVFRELASLLDPTDLLVLNDTKVVPAKIGARRASGGRIAGLFLTERTDGAWEVLLRGSGRLKPGERLTLLSPAEAITPTLVAAPFTTQEECGPLGCLADANLELVAHLGDERWVARLQSADSTAEVLERLGRTPLPPYIRRNGSVESESADRDRYQTTYAKRPGAAAAPTAGLHFSTDTFRQLDARGVARTFVTLHVGPGTFQPVHGAYLDQHPMHREWFDLSPDAAAKIEAQRSHGGRIVAVGTTSVRVLETYARNPARQAGSGWTDLLIHPPYAFQSTDAVITNFHWPRSTLLALVMAFAGVDLTRQAYRHAMERAYRFFSYGDAMLIT